MLEAKTTRFGNDIEVSYTVTVELNDIDTFATFSEAVKCIIEKVREAIGRGTSLMVIESATWIEAKIKIYGREFLYPLPFFDARDLAVDLGIIVNGKGFAEPLPEINESRAILQFVKRSKTGVAAFHQEMEKRISKHLAENPTA